MQPKQVCVVIAGIADPKWPLPPTFGLPELQAQASLHPALSPFDEAALELALKLRDADPATQVRAVVAGDEALARRVLGWRPDSLQRIDLRAVAPWDSAAVTDALAQDPGLGASELVLIGREFGDFDDGSVCALLAHALGLPHVTLGLGLTRREAGWWALRQAATGLERQELPGRAMLSVTNDVGNRLRHPLMKNVMLARKAPIPTLTPPAHTSNGLTLAGVHAAVQAPSAEPCVLLSGSAADQAAALARLLTAPVA